LVPLSFEGEGEGYKKEGLTPLLKYPHIINPEQGELKRGKAPELAYREFWRDKVPLSPPPLPLLKGEGDGVNK